MRADRPGMDETLRLVDRRTVSQRYHCTDPWGGHQPSAHRVAADGIQQHLVQDGQLLAHDLADTEHRLDDCSQPGEALDKLAHPHLVSRASDDAHFQAEITQRAAANLIPRPAAYVEAACGWSAASAVPGQPASSHAPA